MHMYLFTGVLLIAAIPLSYWLKGNWKLVLWLTVAGFVMTILTCHTCAEDFRFFVVMGFVSAAGWISMWLGNVYLNHLLDKKISWRKEPFKRLVAGMVLVIIYTPLVILLLTIPLRVMFGISTGGIYSVLVISFMITVFITLFMTSREFLFNWREMAVNAEKLERESIIARYESLKNQVNPHFLFNSLNALTNLVYEDRDKAAKFIKKLSEVYRYVLDTREREIVSLEEELKFLQSWIYLQQIRFADKLRITINLEGARSMIVPLALQMLVENAIKHNIVSQDHPLGIYIYAAENFIVVENTLQLRHTPEESSGVGLENIRKRYQFLSSGSPVQVSSEKNKFVVKLPFIEMHDTGVQYQIE